MDSLSQQREQEPKFPVAELARLDEMISRRRWVVPVQPKGELEVLLDAAIRLSKEDMDTHSEPCKKFLSEGLAISFTKIMTDESVCNWKNQAHKGILKNAEKLIELVVSKLSQDCFPLLELLAMVLNPQCKFHSCNASRPSETVPADSTVPDDALFARTPDPRVPMGWLVDLVNRFGALQGFQILYVRFASGPQLSVPVMAALILPFGQCAEVLTPNTVQKYFMPIVDIVMKLTDRVTEGKLKKESKTKTKTDALSSIIKSLKQLMCRLPNQKETINNLEIFEQRMVSRKMSDQKEVNSRHSQGDEDKWLASDEMGENNIMDIPWSQIASDTPPQQNKRRDKRKLVMETVKEQELNFPVALLDSLDEKINRLKWDIPISPRGELECLLDAAIKLCKEGLDTRSEPCQRFFREGLTISFTKLMTDEDISNWKDKTHKCILKNTEMLIKLVVAKLSQDCFPLLRLLAMVLNPQCKFHCCNASRPSDTVPADSTLSDDAVFARPPNHRVPWGWLVDLVNRFGELEGFQILYERFASGPQLSVPVIAALIIPFGQSAEVLTPNTVQTYFMPIMDIVLKFLDGVTDEQLKKESKTDSKNDTLSSIINALKQLVDCLPNQKETVKKLNIFRQEITLRLSNSQRNARDELHKVIANVPHVRTSRHTQGNEDKFTWDTVEVKMRDKQPSKPSKQINSGLNRNQTPQFTKFTTDSESTMESTQDGPNMITSLYYSQTIMSKNLGAQEESQLSPKDKVHDTLHVPLQKLPGHAGDMKAEIDQTEAVFVLKQLVQRAESVGLIRSPSTCGTGFRVGPGYIMTAKHVVDQILIGAPVPLRQQMQLSPHDQLSNIDVFIDFDYERNDLQSDKNLRFHFEPVIMYENNFLDTVILQLKPDTKMYPPPLTKFAQLSNAEQHGYFIGHSRAEIKKTDKYQCVTLAPHEITAAKEWSVKHVNVDGFVGIDDPQRVLLHCSFEKGASGAPGFWICPNDGEAYVVLMLLRGYPDWYYDDKYKQGKKIGISPTNLVEQGVSMTSVYEDIQKRDPSLCREIFHYSDADEEMKPLEHF